MVLKICDLICQNLPLIQVAFKMCIRDREEINRLALDKKKTPVIIIDEANYIKNAVLNDLKILFNFEMDSRDPVSYTHLFGINCTYRWRVPNR